MKVTNQRLVRDRMSTQLSTLKPTDTLGDALMILCSEDRRHIPIVEHNDAENTLLGIISDRDVKRRLPTRDNKVDVWDVLENVPVSEFMTRDVITIEPGATLRDAATIMLHGKLSALPVVEGETIVGIITSEDVLWEYIEIS